MGQSASSFSSSYAPGKLPDALEEVEKLLSKLESQIEKRKFFSLTVLLDQPDSSMLSTLRDKIKKFRVEFGFLKMFSNMVDLLSYGIWFELAHLPKIEAGMDEIARNFLIASKKFDKVSKVIIVITNLLEKMELLKPLVEESCDYLGMKHFLEVKQKHPSWDHHFHWESFLRSVQKNLQTLLEKAADLQQLDPLPLIAQIKAFQERLSYLANFFDRVSIAWTRNAYLKSLRIHVGAPTIRAANLSCLCWLRGSKMDQNMAEEMATAFSNLQQKLDPVSSSFLDTMLRFLGTIRRHGDINYPVDMFINQLLGIDREYPFFSEFSDLIKSFIEARDGHNKDVEPILPDMAVVFRQAGSLEVLDSLSIEGGGTADLVHFKLVALLRLLRAEILIIDLLSHEDFTRERTSQLLFQDAPILDKIIRGQVGFLCLNSKSLYHKSADPPEDEMEFWKQVYMLSGEVARDLRLLPLSFKERKLSRYGVRSMLLKWLTSILVFKAKAYLMDLLNCNNSSLVLLVKDDVGTLESLVASILHMPKKLIFVDLEKVMEDEILILMLTESVARQVLSFYHSFHATQFTEGVMELRDQLSGLIEITKQLIREIDVQLPLIKFPKTNGLGFLDFLLIKLREFLKYESGSIFVEQQKRGFLKHKSGSIGFVKEHITVILSNFGFLRSFLGQQDFEHQELREVGIHVVDAAYRVELIIDSIVLGIGSQWKNLSWLYHVSENIGHIKMQVTEFEEEACNVGAGNCSQTMGCEISQTSAFEIAENVAVQQQVTVGRPTTGSSQGDMGCEVSQTSISEITEDVAVLNDQQQLIVGGLMGKSLQRAVGCEISETSTFEISEDVEVLNNQQEVIVDRHTGGSLHKVMGQEISQYSTFEVTKDEAVLNDQQQVMVDQLTRGSSQRNTGFHNSWTSKFDTNEDVVVLDDQQQVIVDRLTRGSSQRDIVSIVGMPGIGKTTLANRVFHSPDVVYYFHVRAWCCVSQVYTKRDLLLGILQHTIELTDSILMMTNEDLEFMLYKNLKGRRYLIFMDDVWNIEAWDDLKSSFPDDVNGSRILMTSRLLDVVSKVTLENDLLDLRPLSEEESWELLKMKVFSKEGCPEELLEVGKEIARNCKGLPLSIVAIAGLLQGEHMKPGSWKQIAESLNSIIVIDPQTRCMDILELSYKHLPDYLKACFLYLGAFQGDKEIPVRRLIWLWMAEGFILKRDSRSLEDLGEGYLRDLIGRSLITVAKRRSNGSVKTCGVHDMVRNLCLLKAKEENFLKLVTNSDEPYASFDDNVDFDDFDPSNSVIYEEHRLCMSMSRQHFVVSRPSGPYVRSLLFFAINDAYPRCPYNVSFISENFELLKVLDLESINMGSSFTDGIDLLVQLSYLAVGGDIDSIPSSLANLRNLETLLVKGLKGKVVLPDSIWHMTRLRHVHVTNHAAFTLKNMTGSYYQLSNLVSLSMPTLSYGEHAEIITRRLPNLRDLSCIFSKSRGFSTDCYQFPRLEDLTRLESLKVVYRGKTTNTGEFNFPSSLKKLSLSNFFFRQDHISAIGRLANLEVLKLLSSSFEDAIWEMGEGEFPELKFLKLDSLNIVEWNASSDHLPNLQHLVLRKCENLKEVPIDFMNIPTLQLIEVQLCGESVEESLRRLKEEQLEYGIEDLKVLINH
ncbi:uncharacterized protein [Coffea arabica]|uniref:Late blight resistance protein homolog R1A-4 n=1 Tax=Coffea arabica TaxID=13443 RepID=A0A6P6VAY7_COFAR|nr:putative late blight resistance protein homolog R1A-4 [Coffea arabica]XP_027099868.1 putative late blight resistance protein homolog R1A-4 [Coffea arabica]XP_027099869.1 putative late blight resistance protein homolog R1A-4 [Coffea arabica]XP_027099870.1 putative late blight resistance protein homolog R1A-4 [Coffea arabica]XP_027099871.1 putative late blight resistance protein homolog R1A-4 [Coffea arabica]XP_027099872.1 putative late blight resistance protein homolog R1A-4 [Coffea arabica]